MSGSIIGFILGVQLAVIAIVFGAPAFLTASIPTIIGAILLMWRYHRGRVIGYTLSRNIDAKSDTV